MIRKSEISFFLIHVLQVTPAKKAIPLNHTRKKNMLIRAIVLFLWQGSVWISFRVYAIGHSTDGHMKGTNWTEFSVKIPKIWTTLFSESGWSSRGRASKVLDYNYSAFIRCTSTATHNAETT